MTLKVIITGAYSTGKSTLAQTLTSQLADADLMVRSLPDVSRDCPMPLNRDQRDDSSLWLIGTQKTREVEAMRAGPQIIICDRGIPDILAHQDDVDRRNGESSVSLLRPFLNFWLKSYDLILYSSVDEAIPIVPDGLRLVDPEYRTYLATLAWNIVHPLQQTLVLPLDGTVRCAAAVQAIMRLPGLSNGNPNAS